MSVIVLEFNELSPVLIEKFMLAGKLPNFRRLYDESEVSITEADAPAPQLEPWIQWVTAHSGIGDARSTAPGRWALRHRSGPLSS